MHLLRFNTFFRVVQTLSPPPLPDRLTLCHTTYVTRPLCPKSSPFNVKDLQLISLGTHYFQEHVHAIREVNNLNQTALIKP